MMDGGGCKAEVVNSNFARQLERELNAAFGGAGLDAAIARMEAILPGMLAECFDAEHIVSMGALERVKARLIAAARGEESQPAAVDWKAKYEEAEYQKDELARKNNNQRESLEGIGRILGIDTDSVTFIKETAAKWKARAEKAEADLARVTVERNHAIDAERSAHRNAKLPRLRPLAEAEPVPEGAIRYYFHKEKDGKWCNGTQRQYASDTHFIDIYPPEDVKPDPFAELKAAHAAGKVIQWKFKDAKRWMEKTANFDEYPDNCDYRIKPDATFEAHGKTWTRHTPGDTMPIGGSVLIETLTSGGDCETAQASGFEWSNGGSQFDIIGYRLAYEPDQPHAEPWQPAVGDVVTLKSGSPEMTIVNDADNGRFWCNWFVGAERREGCFHSAALAAYEAAKKGEP